MKTWKNVWFLGIILIGLLALAGCESDPVAPQESYNNQNIDSETAEK